MSDDNVARGISTSTSNIISSLIEYEARNNYGNVSYLGHKGNSFTKAMHVSQFSCFCNIILGIHEDDIICYNALGKALLEGRKKTNALQGSKFSRSLNIILGIYEDYITSYNAYGIALTEERNRN